MKRNNIFLLIILSLCTNLDSITLKPKAPVKVAPKKAPVKAAPKKAPVKVAPKPAPKPAAKPVPKPASKPVVKAPTTKNIQLKYVNLSSLKVSAVNIECNSTQIALSPTAYTTVTLPCPDLDVSVVATYKYTSDLLEFDVSEISSLAENSSATLYIIQQVNGYPAISLSTKKINLKFANMAWKNLGGVSIQCNGVVTPLSNSTTKSITLPCPDLDVLISLSGNTYKGSKIGFDASQLSSLNANTNQTLNITLQATGTFKGYPGIEFGLYCPSNQVADSTNSVCECPANQVPKTGSNSCICPTGLILDQDGVTCVCPAGQNLQPNGQCCPANQVVGPDGKTCQCYGSQTLKDDGVTCECTISGALPNCNCPKGQVIVSTMQATTCQLCPGNQLADPNDPTNSNCIACPGDLVSYDGTTCQCPLGTTLQGDKCVAPTSAAPAAHQACTVTFIPGPDPANPSVGAVSEIGICK